MLQMRHPFLCISASSFCLTVLCLCFSALMAQAQVTLLVPSQPSIEAPLAPKDAPTATAQAGKDKKSSQKDAQSQPKNRAEAPSAVQSPAAAPAAGDNAAQPAATAGQQTAAEGPAGTESAEQKEAQPEPLLTEEVDVLITMMEPFNHKGLPMDMPQLFAILRYDGQTPLKDGVLQPVRHDLLGDVEEIRYLDQKAWGVNVAMSQPGLYQFIIESRPWWDAARDCYVQHYVKTTLPVYGIERGWELPVGQRFEVQPLTRPFGLTAPVLFAGRVLLEGKALPNAPVRMHRINTDKSTAPTPWHKELAALTDSNGQFAFVLPQAGWWCCSSMSETDPLKGPDGQAKRLELGALLWLYVDAPGKTDRK